MTTFTCRICGATAEHPSYLAREMRYGFRDIFVYFECIDCGCLQISEKPENISKYYPSDYYSQNLVREEEKTYSLMKTFTKARVLDSYLGHMDPVGRFLRVAIGDPWCFLPEMKLFPLRADYKVLDVGCGDGHRLKVWRKSGFHRLYGIDPFVERDLEYADGVKVFKQTPDEHEGQYDFIMAHHSLEHMWNQQEMLNHFFRLLRGDRYVEIRIPIASSDAWERYRTNWIALDAPRHLCLHSFESFAMIAGRAGFEIKKTIHDSDATEIWGSEQYKQDIPLQDPRSYYVDKENSIFTLDQIQEFGHRVERLNAQGRSQQAIFALYKPPYETTKRAAQPIGGHKAKTFGDWRRVIDHRLQS